MRDRLRCVTEEIEDWKWLAFKGEDGEGGEGSRRGSQREGDEDGEGDGEGEDVKMEDGERGREDEVGE